MGSKQKYNKELSSEDEMGELSEPENDVPVRDMLIGAAVLSIILIIALLSPRF